MILIDVLTLPVRVLLFAGWFTREVVRSSWQVVGDVLRPGRRATPRIVQLPLGHASDTQVTTIGVLITLTPGTLTLGAIRSDQGERAILVHSMYHRDADTARADLHDMYCRMMRSVRIGAQR